MYAAIWRALPGPWPVKLVLALVLLAGIAYLLIFHLYPWIMQEFFPTPDPVLDASAHLTPQGIA
ncbi:hypothetical protein [Agrococcus baldri]|uniref:DUF4175 domain-containing protein n=1 Tax=Agrococcus baldri TaxID=153730 RepID=A0AA87USI2_9MICO|nr:hypothetical protein [Agrococcus baldri]GEK80415.1 hypothetical protein ABA31_17660 [Agrococcus baldri]